MNNSHRRQRWTRVAATIGAAAAAAAFVPTSIAQQGDPLTGDPDRGQGYFTTEYKCYACHGFDAQTGQRRLKPMNYTQQGFITFVQNSPLPQMPAYPDMPAQALADVYAYIQSIPIDAPDVDDVPALSEIRERKLESFD
jgi:mono/diheme cytochrome c family protein